MRAERDRGTFVMIGQDHRRNLLGVLTAAMLVVAGSANAAELVPFTAVYDLTLTGKSMDLAGGSGRIAAALTRESCARIVMDYRFVARFEREDATVVTEQRTVSTEDRAAGTFAFTTKTFVGGDPESTIRGTAAHSGERTMVEIEEPERGHFDLPLSVFPSAHTKDLIEKAERGERLVETRLYDGDNEAGKRLTTTAVITPATPATPAVTSKDGEAAAKSPGEALAALRHWRINESYYNSDGAADGLPLFQTSYTLYENGVSDALTIDTGDYAFSGSLSKLELGKADASCPAGR